MVEFLYKLFNPYVEVLILGRNKHPSPLHSADPIFVKMNSMKVVDIYKYQVEKFLFKCLNRGSNNLFVASALKLIMG